MSWELQAPSPWQQQAEKKPDFADNEELKKLFAIELARGQVAFAAGLTVFGGNTSNALWASVHWVRDIKVIAYRDTYLNAQKSVETPLDKEQLLSKLKEFAETASEDKERLGAWRLYSDISGFTGRVDINAPTTNNFTNKTVNLVLVKPEDKAKSQISNTKSQIINEDGSLVKLKLVSAN